MSAPHSNDETSGHSEWWNRKPLIDNQCVPMTVGVPLDINGRPEQSHDGKRELSFGAQDADNQRFTVDPSYTILPNQAVPPPTAREKNPLTASCLRRFHLVRTDDETGISGTGVVAEGVEFSDGTCVMSWLTAMRSTAVYPNARTLEAIHGHNGRAKIKFID